VYQYLAQVDVAALADAQKLGLAAGRVLPWNESEPRREVSPLAERCAVADSRNDSLSRCHLDSERTNTSNRDAEPHTHWWKASNNLKKEMESKIGC